MADRDVRDVKKEWAAKFQPLVGRKIKTVRWMYNDELVATGWSKAPIVLVLDDDTLLYPSMDDEGNDAGALFTQEGRKTKGLEPVAPVIR
jgi:hypothetical protein